MARLVECLLSMNAFSAVPFALGAGPSVYGPGAALAHPPRPPRGSRLTACCNVLTVLFPSIFHAPPFIVVCSLNADADDDKQMINLGSYNYLGFADDWGETCRTDVSVLQIALRWVMGGDG